MDVDDVHYVLIPVRMACRVCVSGSAAYALECWYLEVCTSLCPWRVRLGKIVLQVLGRQARQLSLSCSPLVSGDRAGLLVSFPKGMVSYKPGQALKIEPRIFCWDMWLCSVDLVAWGVGSHRGGGLCLP